MTTPVLLLADPRMTAHDPGPHHPESPARLRAILERLHGTSVPGVRWEEPTFASAEALGRVHPPAHLARIDSVDGIRAQLDPDTRTSPESITAARLAAGAVVGAVDAVLDGTARRAFALVRPPGHHAEPDTAMGFCFLNNVAVAAEHARARGLQRVLVLDWDVHHGNGTQAAFYERSDVLFVSSHQFPLYPGTGRITEHGSGGGLGFTVNLPLPAGTGDGGYVATYRRVVAPIVEQFRPELILVSAGFDPHRDDPLAGMRMTDEGFAALCGLVRDWSDTHAEGRLVLTLEGGYDLDALADSALACVRVLAGDTPPGVAAPTPADERAIGPLLRAQGAHWKQ